MKQIQIQCAENGWIVVYNIDGKTTINVFSDRVKLDEYIAELLDATATEE